MFGSQARFTLESGQALSLEYCDAMQAEFIALGTFDSPKTFLSFCRGHIASPQHATMNTVILNSVNPCAAPTKPPTTFQVFLAWPGLLRANDFLQRSQRERCNASPIRSTTRALCRVVSGRTLKDHKEQRGIPNHLVILSFGLLI